MWDAVIKLIGGAAAAGLAYMSGRQAQKNDDLEKVLEIKRKQERVYKKPRPRKSDLSDRLR